MDRTKPNTETTFNDLLSSLLRFVFVAVVHSIVDNDDSEEEDVIILTAERSDVIQKRYVWTIKKTVTERQSYKTICEFRFSFLP